MPFEYTPYRSPFTGAIADLIGRQGDIAAQQALNEAKARTQAVSGVAQSLGNLAQYRADAPKREMERMRIAEARQQMADAQEARAGKQSLATLLSPDYVEGFQPQGPTPVDASGEAGILPKSRSLVKNIGGVKQLDPDAIQAAMGQLGHGAWFLENRNAIDNLNKSMLDRHVLGQKAIQNAADLYKRAARQSADTLDDRFKVQAAQTLVDALDNIVPGDQLEAIQKALGVGDTRMIDQFANQYATPDKIEWLKTGPGEVNTPLNQYGQQVAPAIQGPERPKTTAQITQELRGAYAVPDKERTPAQQQLIRGFEAELQATAALKNKTYQEAFLDAASGGDYMTASPEQQAVANRAWRDSTTRAPQPQKERLVQVRRFDPETGTNVVEFVSESEARDNGPYRAPVGSAEISRKNTATALTKTGDDVLKSLQNPVLAEQLGIAMGRFNTLQDFVGNPPPEFAQLAGELKSFAAANMTVHGFRSSAGADKVFEMLNQQQTPEALSRKIKGLMQFTKYYLSEYGDSGDESDKSDGAATPKLLFGPPPPNPFNK